MRLRSWGPATLAGLLLLGACASPPADEPAATLPAPAAILITETPEPAAAAGPATESTEDSPEEAAAPTAEALPAGAEAAALYKGAPQGATEDGFFSLGDATAPATLTDYSDFL